MKYSEFKKKATKGPCPFCVREQRTFASNASAYLTYCIAPYAKYHMLVIPKRHETSFLGLTPQEWKDARTLLVRGIGALTKKGIADYTVMIRNGERTGRTVEHLHFHIVPRHRIGDLDHKGRSRPVLSPSAVAKLTEEIVAAL